MPTNAEKLQIFLRSRRSIRRFKPDPVPPELVERIIETATYAPSAHNLQPWRFVVLDSQSSKQLLGEALTKAMQADMLLEGAVESDIHKRTNNSLRRLSEAPITILLCRDLTAVRQQKPEDMVMAIQSVANAGLQLLLAAHAEGLGGNWICWPLYAQGETRQVLGLPDSWEPQALFFIGYPAMEPSIKEMHTSQVIIHK